VDATEKSIRDWFGAGVTCVGIGSKLVSKDLVAARDYGGISQRVAQVLAWIEKARSEHV
jgi:2-dehydro-3-deoxyphosphogluconate aldolase/(4S)-4-hydroxy-2-oxoglutarate aldolase